MVFTLSELMPSNGRSGDETKRVTSASPRTLKAEGRKPKQVVLCYKIHVLKAANERQSERKRVVLSSSNPAAPFGCPSTRTSRRIFLFGGAKASRTPPNPRLALALTSSDAAKIDQLLRTNSPS